MSNGWKLRSRPNVEEWQVGKVVTGVFKGLRHRRLSDDEMLDLLGDDGRELTLSCSAALRSSLEDVPVGARIRIRCVGGLELAPGRVNWAFRVYEEDVSEHTTT